MFTINNKNLCECCFSEVTGDECPVCGFSPSSYKPDPQVLPCGSILMGKYIIGKVIGKGGFGITYYSYDVTTDSIIAIKEYFPTEIVTRAVDDIEVYPRKGEEKMFQKGAEKFYDEASFLAKFNNNPNIVNIYEFFHENNTVYLTMEYLKGITLKEYVKENGTVTTELAINIAKSICSALGTIHKENILHRDISPDNIMICDNGNIKLIDFGAARQVYPATSQLLSVILKPGFAPLEQYQKKGKQGPWTDLYSLGTTLFYALTLKIPDDPMTRLEGDETFEVNQYGIDNDLWNVIKKASNLSANARFQTAEEFIGALNSISKPAPPPPPPPPAPEPAEDDKKKEEIGKTVEIKKDDDRADNEVKPEPQPKKPNKASIAAGVAAAVIVAGLVISLMNDNSDSKIAQDQVNTPPTTVSSVQEPSRDVTDAPAEQTPETETTTTAAPTQEETAAVTPSPQRPSEVNVGLGTFPGFDTITDIIEESTAPEGTSSETTTTTTTVTETSTTPSSTTPTSTTPTSTTPTSTAPSETSVSKTTTTSKPPEETYVTNRSCTAGGVAMTYTGEWKNGNPHGKGSAKITQKNATMTTYDGYFKNGIFEGKGTSTYSNGDSYTGDWSDGNMNGSGTYKWANGTKYVGSFKNGKFNGHGVEYTKDGKVYIDAEYKDGALCGKGTYYFDDGGKYVGEFKNGKFNGYGTEYNSGNKKRCEGTYKDGNLNDGTFYFDNGSYYVGSFRNGRINGSGKEFDPQHKLTYEGTYKDGKIISGTYYFKNGAKYVGAFNSDAQFHGSGKEYTTTGKLQYEGEWKNGKYDGQGTLYILEGDLTLTYHAVKYVGGFKNGLFHGDGILYDAAGNRVEDGRFEYGELVA